MTTTSTPARRTARATRRLAARAALPLLVATVGCAELETPDDLARAPFDPPPVYASLWNQVQECSGRLGDPGRVRWFLADSFPDRPRRLAQWEPGHRITLRSDLDVALPIVAHEILHDLLEGDPAHEDEAWLECALPVHGAHAAE